MSKYTQYLICLLFTIISLFGIFIAYKTYEQAPETQVYINPVGLSKIEHQTLSKLLAKRSKGSFFQANVQNIRDEVSGLSWIDEVSVKRDWHKGIVIEAITRKPVAHFGSERFVDGQGQVFTPVDKKSANTGMSITLQGDTDQAVVIMYQMKNVNKWFKPLDMKVVDMILTPRQTWIIRFNTGVRVIVDGENTTQKLINVSNILQNQVLNKLDMIQVVDARYKNGFAITWNN